MSLARGSALICGLVAGKVTVGPRRLGRLWPTRRLLRHRSKADLFKLHAQGPPQGAETVGQAGPILDPGDSAKPGVAVDQRDSQWEARRHHPFRSGAAWRKRPATLDRYVRVKYRFSESASQRRFYDLLLRLMNALADSYGKTHGPETVVGWNEYATSVDPQVIEIDEALSEQVHLLAGMAAADGAVVLARPLGIVGFGGEICGRLKHVDFVWRALDREGLRGENEATSGVGTRHRSVYRLCNSLPTASAHRRVAGRGGVRIVRQVDGRVTYWEQLPGDVFGLRSRGIALTPERTEIPRPRSAASQSKAVAYRGRVRAALVRSATFPRTSLCW